MIDWISMLIMGLLKNMMIYDPLGFKGDHFRHLKSGEIESQSFMISWWLPSVIHYSVESSSGCSDWPASLRSVRGLVRIVVGDS